MSGSTDEGGRQAASMRDETPLFGVPSVVVRRLLGGGYFTVLAVSLLLRLVPGSGGLGRAASEAVLTVVVTLATYALYHAFARTTGPERSFWGFTCLTALFLLISRFYDVVATSLPQAVRASTGALPGVMDIAAVVTFLALLTSFSRFRHSSAAARVRYVLDVVVIALIVATALESWVVGPWFERLGITDVWARVAFSVSPVAAILGFIGMVTVLVGTRIDRWETWERVLAGSVTCFALVLAFAPIDFADRSASLAGGMVNAASDLIWLTAVWLGMSGAVLRHLGWFRTWRVRPVAILEPSYGWLPSVILPTAEVLALPLFGLAVFASADPSIRATRIASVGVIAVAIAVRTILTVMDTDALTAGAVADPLTGLFDHRHFQERFARELADAVRYGEQLSVAVFDVDDFADVNATGGHAAGDEALTAVARAAQSAVRTRDVVCRTGGDGFAVILPATDADAAHAVTARIVDAIRDVVVNRGRGVTVSAGVASLSGEPGDVVEMLERADAALYWAKTHGKDRVAAYDPAVMVVADPQQRARSMRERADSATVRALAAAVDARDEATQDHSRNVARYAVALAEDLGLDERTMTLLGHAATLHDVGKIGVPDAVLRKQGVLTSAERAAMQEHVVVGEAILASASLQEVLPWVRAHHERWDGTGYPDGLAGDAIPLGARIIALANAYDAMRSARPHRPGMSRHAALQEIDLALGTAFDPELGERFIDVVGRRYL